MQTALSGTSQRTAPFSSQQTAARRNARTARCRAAQVPRCSAAEQQPSLFESVSRAAAALALAASVTLSPMVAPPEVAPQAAAALTARDPIKNARALLRNALPVNNKSIRQIQESLESISELLRVPGSKPLGGIERAVRKAENVLGKDRQKIIADFSPEKKDAGLLALASLDTAFKNFNEVIQNGDKQGVPDAQAAALQAVGEVEEAMVKGFPFEVPAEYANLPQLKGRATIDMDIKFKEPRDNGTTGGVMRIVVDGFNAPVSAGNFVDLVLRGFYNNTEIQRADGFVVQFGQPEGGDGFKDPKTGQVRRIPFEVMVQGDKTPVYELTLEDIGRFNEQPVLPFNAFGTMAVARAEFEPNSGSSQMFFLLKESELTPTGSNLLDGRYAVFGYIVDNYNMLKDMKVGDKIVKVTVLSGAENLQQPKE